MSKTVDYYKLLGISIFANEEEIRSAYLSKIKLYHPDTFNGNKREAENVTSSLNLAYDTLKDKDKKYVYDQKYGFDKLRDEFLKEKEKEQQKIKRQEKTKLKKHQNPNTGDYAHEKVSREKMNNEAKFNEKTTYKQEKVKTGFFSKKPVEDVKSVKRKVLTPEEQSEKKQRLILDFIIIGLLVIIILLLLFH